MSEPTPVMTRSMVAVRLSTRNSQGILTDCSALIRIHPSNKNGSITAPGEWLPLTALNIKSDKIKVKIDAPVAR